MLLKILSTITDKIKKTLFNLYTDPKEETVEEETIIQGRFHLYNYGTVVYSGKLNSLLFKVGALTDIN